LESIVGGVVNALNLGDGCVCVESSVDNANGYNLGDFLPESVSKISKLNLGEFFSKVEGTKVALSSPPPLELGGGRTRFVISFNGPVIIGSRMYVLFSGGGVFSSSITSNWDDNEIFVSSIVVRVISTSLIGMPVDDVKEVGNVDTIDIAGCVDAPDNSGIDVVLIGIELITGIGVEDKAGELTEICISGEGVIVTREEGEEGVVGVGS